VLPKAVISKAVVGDLMALPSPCHCPPDSAHRRQRQTGRAARIAHHRHGRWDRRAGGAVLGALDAFGAPSSPPHLEKRDSRGPQRPFRRRLEIMSRKTM
jgi:hypothetical protein